MKKNKAAAKDWQAIEHEAERQRKNARLVSVIDVSIKDVDMTEEQIMRALESIGNVTVKVNGIIFTNGDQER